MKRVLVLVVDGCTSRVLGPAIASGELPTLATLADRGSLNLECVSVFPSITPTATASIVTGRYPARHGIAGMSWWNPSTGDVSYFGDDVWTVLSRGIGEFLQGFLLGANGERLQAPTLFQLVERHRRRAACFNHLIFRGDVPHEISQPLLLRFLPSVPARMTVHGPSWLSLGDFVSHAGARDLDTSGGPFHRFGLDDEGTAGFLKNLQGADALPDFTVAYFADYDFASHEKGPHGASGTLRRFDDHLAEIFDRWGGLDRVLTHTSIVLTADHSHSEVLPDAAAAIDLNAVLSGYRCADPMSGWREGEEILLCPNMRAAEIYVRPRSADRLAGVRTALLEHPAIDHVIWRDSAGDLARFCVGTSDRGELSFERAVSGAQGVVDEYGGPWEIRGERGVLDLSLDRGHVRSRVYPNALERIANGVDHPRSGRLWVTARPGYEFRVAGQSVHHGGGSHGTLHELDSVVPLLVCAATPLPALHRAPRIVDVAPYCAQVLGIPFDVRPGASHC